MSSVCNYFSSAASAIYNYFAATETPAADEITVIDATETPVIHEITETTTPEQFERLRIRFPQFQFNYMNEDGETVLHKAAELGNIQLIKHIVRQAPELLERGDKRGRTPLVIVAADVQLAATNALIELGANVNVSHLEKGQEFNLLNHIAFYRLCALVQDEIINSKGINLIERVRIKHQLRVATGRQLIKVLVKNGAQLSSFRSYPQDLYFPAAQLVEQQDNFLPGDKLVEQAVDEARKQTSKALDTLTPLPKTLSNKVVEYQDDQDFAEQGIDASVKSIVEEARQELAEERRALVEKLDPAMPFMPIDLINIVADYS